GLSCGFTSGPRVLSSYCGAAGADRGRRAVGSSRSHTLVPPLYPAGDLNGVVLGVGLPALDDAVAIGRIEFANESGPAGLMGGNQGRTAPGDETQNDGIAHRYVLSASAIICTGLTVG